MNKTTEYMPDRIAGSSPTIQREACCREARQIYDGLKQHIEKAKSGDGDDGFRCPQFKKSVIAALEAITELFSFYRLP